MIRKNLTGNDTLHEHSLGAKYEYSCKETGNPEDDFLTASLKIYRNKKVLF